jgi:hypothetical protein
MNTLPLVPIVTAGAVLLALGCGATAVAPAARPNPQSALQGGPAPPGCGHPSTVLDCADRRAPRLWRVTGSRSVSLGPGAAADVDAGRVVAFAATGAVRVLDRDGSVLSAVPAPDATSAQLSGDDLVVVRDDALEVWDVRTGKRRAAYPLERGFGPTPLVEDAEQGIATVVTGVAIHLIRLSDGKDLVLDIDNQAGPSHAELEPTGLFYSWNEPYTRKPGRLAFVPWEQVVAAFERAG